MNKYAEWYYISMNPAKSVKKDLFWSDGDGEDGGGNGDGDEGRYD